MRLQPLQDPHLQSSLPLASESSLSCPASLAALSVLCSSPAPWSRFSGSLEFSCLPPGLLTQLFLHPDHPDLQFTPLIPTHRNTLAWTSFPSGSHAPAIPPVMAHRASFVVRLTHPRNGLPYLSSPWMGGQQPALYIWYCISGFQHNFCAL